MARRGGNTAPITSPRHTRGRGRGRGRGCRRRGRGRRFRCAFAPPTALPAAASAAVVSPPPPCQVVLHRRTRVPGPTTTPPWVIHPPLSAAPRVQRVAQGPSARSCARPALRDQPRRRRRSRSRSRARQPLEPTQRRPPTREPRLHTPSRATLSRPPSRRHRGVGRLAPGGSVCCGSASSSARTSANTSPARCTRTTAVTTR